MTGNSQRQRPVSEGSLVQHLDNRQGRVCQLGPVDGLPGALVEWFRGGREWVVLGYIYATSMEESE